MALTSRRRPGERSFRIDSQRWSRDGSYGGVHLYKLERTVATPAQLPGVFVCMEHWNVGTCCFPSDSKLNTILHPCVCEKAVARSNKDARVYLSMVVLSGDNRQGSVSKFKNIWCTRNAK